MSAGRRRFLKTAAAVSVAGPLLAGCTGTGSSSGDDGASTFDGWFNNTVNYDGVTDKTDASEVIVMVGAESDNGPYVFAPPAIRIGTGTTVTWEWTGKGGAHNVVAQDGTFKSKLSAEKGYTFEHTFDTSGTYKYYCLPHKSMGMKGIVEVA